MTDSGNTLKLPTLEIEQDLSVLADDPPPAAPPAASAPIPIPPQAPVEDAVFVRKPAAPAATTKAKRPITDKQRAHLEKARQKAADKRQLAQAERDELAALREEKKRYAARTKPSAAAAPLQKVDAAAAETFNKHLPTPEERKALQQEDDNKRYDAFLSHLARYEGVKARRAPPTAPVVAPPAPAPAPPPERKVSFNILQPPRNTRSNYDNWF